MPYPTAQPLTVRVERKRDACSTLATREYIPDRAIIPRKIKVGLAGKHRRLFTALCIQATYQRQGIYTKV